VTIYYGRVAAGVKVVLAGVSKRYGSGPTGVTALGDVSLSIPAGATVAVMGPSGSGKSTLLNLIGAMDRADGGTIRVGDREVTALRGAELADLRRTIGFVFQRFHLLQALTAVDNVAAPLLPQRTKFDKHERARELLAAVGLAGRERALPSQLAGGEQQRVAIARALVNDPVLVLADEPTGNLDSATGAEIMDLILRLRAERGMTVVVATHNARVAARCERVVRLSDGRLTDTIAVAPAQPPAQVLERISRIEP
jgi:putative ABC transport system ATP-binding protein